MTGIEIVVFEKMQDGARIQSTKISLLRNAAGHRIDGRNQNSGRNIVRVEIVIMILPNEEVENYIRTQWK